MTGSFLSAWILFPLVLLAGSVGGGLLIRRVSGGALPPGLVTPVGFALMVAICAFVTSFERVAPAAGWIVAVVALIGFTLEIRARAPRLPRLRPGPWVWPALAALAASAAVGGPVLLTGTTTWAGYTRIVDIAFQMDFANYLAEAGRHTPPLDSSYHVAVNKLTIIGYPGGGQAVLGSMAHLIHTDVAWCYQCYLAFVAAMGALAIFSLLGRVTSSAALCALGGAVAIQPNLLYGYSQEGAIKELTTATLLLLVVGLLAERLPGEGPAREVIPAAVAISAAFAAFSVGIAPWLGLLLVALLIVTLVRSERRRSVLRSWALLTGVAAGLSLPSLISAVKLATIAGEAVGGVVDLGLGNLAAAVPAWSAAGVWLTSDYRYPLAHVTATHTLDVLVIALAVLGTLFALRRRRWALAMLGLSAPVALYYWIAHTGPWIEFKAFSITAVIALTLAFAGAGALCALRSRWTTPLGWLAALLVAGAVLYGNAIIYHDTSLAPAARYRDLASIGKRYAGQGPLLFPEFDEYAEYFLREERATDLVNPAYGHFPLATGVSAPPGGTSFTWDLNQIDPAFVQTFPLIVTPSNPTANRAPSDYDLVERTRYFDVWRRNRPTRDVVVHFPLSNLPHERTQRFCRHLAQVALAAGPGAEVAYAQASVAAVASPAQGAHPDYWKATGPNVVSALGAGTDQLQLTLPRSGRYGIWLNGTVGRPLAIYMDGRRLRSVGYEERYPDQFLLLDSETLSAGPHVMRLVRGNGSLHPGSGDPATDAVGRTIGAIVFAPEDATVDRVYVAPAARAAQVCAAPVGYEWLEILRPGGAPTNAIRVSSSAQAAPARAATA